jgi:hypothetical protein
LAGDDVLSGVTRYAVAFGETDAPYALDEITTEARETPDGWRLSGRKTVVYGAGTADRLLILAAAPDGPGLFDIAASDAEIAAYGMIDGGPAGEITLDATPATRLDVDAGTIAQDMLDWAALALSAEALGAMETTFAMLTDYLGTRTQFGKPIGTFQALQHRTAVDLSIEIEQARSIVIAAAAAMGTPEQSQKASQCKHLTGRIARQVAEEAIQMHGGIAMTWEYPVSHYAKRLVMIDHQFGDTDHHLERLIARCRRAVQGFCTSRQRTRHCCLLRPASVGLGVFGRGLLRDQTRDDAVIRDSPDDRATFLDHDPSRAAGQHLHQIAHRRLGACLGPSVLELPNPASITSRAVRTPKGFILATNSAT